MFSFVISKLVSVNRSAVFAVESINLNLIRVEARFRPDRYLQLPWASSGKSTIQSVIHFASRFVSLLRVSHKSPFSISFQLQHWTESHQPNLSRENSEWKWKFVYIERGINVFEKKIGCCALSPTLSCPRRVSFSQRAREGNENDVKSWKISRIFKKILKAGS